MCLPSAFTNDIAIWTVAFNYVDPSFIAIAVPLNLKVCLFPNDKKEESEQENFAISLLFSFINKNGIVSSCLSQASNSPPYRI